MDDLVFSWDAKKDRANQKKHGVSFEEAKTVFLDNHGRLMSDPAHSENEERYLLLGLSWKTRLLVISHNYSDPENTIRIISARKAEKSEYVIYEKFKNER